MALERKQPSLAQQKANLVSHFEYKRTSHEGSPGGYHRTNTGGGGIYGSASSSALGHKRPSEKGDHAAAEANQHYMKMLSQQSSRALQEARNPKMFGSAQQHQKKFMATADVRERRGDSSSRAGQKGLGSSGYQSYREY